MHIARYIGKISYAEVDMQGMTVLVGNNSTGKSTISKSLYAIIQGFHNFNEKINDRKRYHMICELRNWFNPIMTALKSLNNNKLYNKILDDTDEKKIGRRSKGLVKNVLKKLPIGIENFSEFFTDNFYYVDKTGFLIELLNNWGKVNLFTRPRRFGKSLNMSMLQTFFEIGCKRELFDGLEVSKEKELCDEYMGRFPVVSITLKGVGGTTFIDARNALCDVIGNEALRFQFLGESENLTVNEKKLYLQLIEVNPPMVEPSKKQAVYAMPDAVLEQSLKTLTELLSKHYERKVIVLIDEYDVPLDKAFNQGFYDNMVNMIRNMFGNVLKTNNYLQFAVLTGCLRISKESIFTGLNNLKISSITNARYDEYFGFTDDEVKSLLEYYDLTEHFDSIKAWYNGYQFGKSYVYCPWDVISYCDALLEDPDAEPEDYWANTSDNGMVLRFIDKANRKTKDEIEQLIAGEAFVKTVRQDLTYNEIDKTIENLWSVLFMTGYLTHRGKEGSKMYRLAIPNKEIRDLFEYQINTWFNEKSLSDTHKLDNFCESFPNESPENIEKLFNEYLRNTISIRDTAVRKERKENFYHGILLGLLGHKESWDIRSNMESGEGYSDIIIEIVDELIGVVIEIKYAEDNKLDESCEEALRQIEEKCYDAQLIADGMKTVVKYGIACYRKHCKVVKA